MSIVKVHPKGQMTIPRNIRSRVGLADGDLVEVKATGGQIVITPKGVARSKFQTADDEYTPAQRRVIDAQLAENLEDVKKGRIYGPFDTVEEFERSLRTTAKKLKGKTSRSTRG